MTPTPAPLCGAGEELLAEAVDEAGAGLPVTDVAAVVGKTPDGLLAPAAALTWPPDSDPAGYSIK